MRHALDLIWVSLFPEVAAVMIVRFFDVRATGFSRRRKTREPVPNIRVGSLNEIIFHHKLIFAACQILLA